MRPSRVEEEEEEEVQYTPHGCDNHSTVIERRWAAISVALLLLPVGLALLVVRPELVLAWEHHPSHFWPVLGAAGVSGPGPADREALLASAG